MSSAAVDALLHGLQYLVTGAGVWRCNRSSQAAPEHKTTLTHPAPGINNAQHSAVIFSVVGSAMREQKNNLIRETIWKNVVILYRVQFTCHGGH